MQTDQAPDAMDSEAPLAGEPEVMDVDTPETDAPSDTPEAAPTVDAAGAMMRADYQRKTAELAREREAMRAEAERLQYLKDYEAILAERPDLAEHVQNTLASQERNVSDPKMTRELRQVQVELAEMKQAAFFDSLNTAATRVAKEFGMTTEEMVAVVRDEWEDRAISIGMDPGTLNKRITKAAKAAGYDKARQGGESDLAQKLRDKAKAASPKAKSAAPEPKEPDTSAMTSEERVNYMLRLANRKAR